MERLVINNILKLTELESELEHERAISLYLRLRKYEQDNPSYIEIRAHLRVLIEQYEKQNWSEASEVTDQQIKENDLAEILVRAENEFYYNRKELIKKRLKDVDLSQYDLAKILNYSKEYMLELINGFRSFSKEDIVIINRLLKIRLEHLVPTFIQQDRATHIKKTLKEIDNNKIKLTKKDFDLYLV